MTEISLSFPISDDRRVTLSAENPRELTDLVTKLGGDGKEVADQVKLALSDPTQFVVVPRALVSEIQGTDSASGATTTTTSAGDSPSDPWADEPTEPDDDDPWAEPAASPTKARTTSSPSSAKPSAASTSSQSSDEINYVNTDRFGRKFHHGLPEAPQCDHGEPAAKMTAKKKSGKGNYSKWVCDKVNNKADEWRDKCDFEDWAN